MKHILGSQAVDETQRTGIICSWPIGGLGLAARSRADVD